MTLSRTFARSFIHLSLIVGFLGCGVSIAEMSETNAQTSTPGVSECFNSSTGQISTVAGECPSN